MNFLNHRQKTPGHVLQMPEGLQELLGDISREVLRCQPSIDCTYKFIADYLEAMVKTRDSHKIAMEVIEDAILKTDEVYSEFAKCNFPKDKTNSFLDAMELTFRRFVDKKRQNNQDTRFIKFHPDDMLEELMRKCDLTKVEVLRSRPAIQWAYRKFVKTYLAAIEGTLDTEDLYFDTEKVVASSKERNQIHQSAVQIQKVFRGYKTRQSLQGSQKLTFAEDQISEDSSSTSSFLEFILGREEEISKAAIKIQASFKGFYVRKKNVLEKKKVSLRPHIPEPEVQEFTSAMKNQSLFDIFKSREDSLGEEELPSNLSEVAKVTSIEAERRQVSELSISSQNNINNNLHETHHQTITFQEDKNNNYLQEIQEETLEVSSTNPQDLNEAAIKIQATFKGYRVRKEMSNTANKEKLPNTPEEQHSDVDPDTTSKQLQD